MDATELKALQEEQLRLWEQFKSENDKRIGVLEKSGVDLGTKLATLDQMNGRFDEIETKMNRLRRADDYKPEQTEAAKVFWKQMRYGVDALEAAERKVLTVGDDTAAGYLAPKEYVLEIIKGETVFSPIRSIARIRQTSNRAIQIPRRTAQFAASWVAETGTRSETTGLTYGLEEIPAHEMYALVDISNQEIEDSAFDIEAEVRSECEAQFGVAEGTAFVSGTGVGKPLGFLPSVDANVGSTVSGSAAVIADADGQANGIITLFHAVKEAYAANGNWVLSRTTLGALRKLKDADKNYIWTPGVAGLIPNSIQGRPYIEATDMPSEAANAYPIAFGDFRRAYTIVDRVTISILRDPFTQAATGAVRFVARKRVGGKVVLAEAIRCLKCST